MSVIRSLPGHDMTGRELAQAAAIPRRVDGPAPPDRRLAAALLPCVRFRHDGSAVRSAAPPAYRGRAGAGRQRRCGRRTGVQEIVPSRARFCPRRWRDRPRRLPGGDPVLFRIPQSSPISVAGTPVATGVPRRVAVIRLPSIRFLPSVAIFDLVCPCASRCLTSGMAHWVESPSRSVHAPSRRPAGREEGGDESRRLSRCCDGGVYPPPPLANANSIACSSAATISVDRRTWPICYG